MTQLRFLALGDSYTIGEGVAPHERWPVVLADSLRSEGVDLADPVIVATTGWTTDELAAGIAAAGIGGRYDLVSLLIGVNNQYRGRPIREYREQLLSLLRQAVGFAGDRPSRLLVLSIPDWGVTPFAAGRDAAAIAAGIDAFNAVNRAEAERAGARWVDVTAHSRAAGAAPEMLVADGLHPSGAAYAEWARLALPAAREALGSP